MISQNLRIPGPTPCPPEVLEAMGKQMINHRGPEFAVIIHRVTDKLKRLFKTKNDLYLLTASGSGAMEAAIVNVLSPGDKVLAITNGAFGDRFAVIAQSFGAMVIQLEFEWSNGADPNVVEEALKREPDIKAVLIVHNETSTGVTNPLKEVAAVAKRYGKLVIVDAISSIGSIELPVDEWQCDVVASCSQKSWMIPPGLSMVSISEQGWEAYKTAKMPRCYFDLGEAKRYLAIGQTPWTPAVSNFFALDISLDLVDKEGLDNIIARHQRLGKFTREQVKALGLPLFADEKYASDTVTAIAIPEGMDGPKFMRLMREEQGVVLAGGQTKLQGKIFRIGHVGWVNQADLEAVFDAMRWVLPQAGFSPLKAPAPRTA